MTMTANTLRVHYEDGASDLCMVKSALLKPALRGQYVDVRCALNRAPSRLHCDGDAPLSWHFEITANELGDPREIEVTEWGGCYGQNTMTLYRD